MLEGFPDPPPYPERPATDSKVQARDGSLPGRENVAHAGANAGVPGLGAELRECRRDGAAPRDRYRAASPPVRRTDLRLRGQRVLVAISPPGIAAHGAICADHRHLVEGRGAGKRVILQLKRG